MSQTALNTDNNNQPGDESVSRKKIVGRQREIEEQLANTRQGKQSFL